MSPKKTLVIGLSVIAACLLFCVVFLFVNRSTQREPTAQEIEACEIYKVDWQDQLGAEGSEKALILSLCTFTEEKTIGGHTYNLYSSDTLGAYLYRFREFIEIALSGDSVLYVQYYDLDGRMVTLGYADTGLQEMAVYDPETDTLYHELEGNVEVWTKFRNGIQWGA